MIRFPGARLACGVLLGLVSLSAFAQTPRPTLDKIRATQILTIAYRESSVPFSYVVDGRPVGFAVELCERIAGAVQKHLRLARMEVRYLLVTPATRMDAVRTGQADLECGSTTNTAERRKQVAFTVPHYIAGARLAVRSTDGVKELGDLRNKRIALTKGTTTVKIVEGENAARLLNLTFVEGKDHAESFGFVESGKADAFAMDDILLYSLRAASAEPQKTTVVGELLSIEPLAIMLRREDPEFKKVVDGEMARIALDGEGQRLYTRWFQQPIPPKGITLGIPMGRLLRDAWRFPTDQVAD